MKSWREIIKPREEIRRGQFENVEFAADLTAVAAHRAAPSYQNAAAFFAQTYMTAGLKDLLEQALRRICGLGGNPVVQLETSFGGGKTHSMIALYHLFESAGAAGVKELLSELGIEKLPKVHRAAIVGTNFPAQENKQTLWGEICAQLAKSAGKEALYNKYIKSYEEDWESPPESSLTAFLDGCGSCLILLDEVVAYGKNLYKPEERYKFDKLMVFVQTLAQAVTKSRSSMVVATLPASAVETGEGAGLEVKQAVQHYFRELQAVKTIAAAEEGFHIVRLRLFDKCGDEAALEKVCVEFSEMYRRNDKEFPAETRKPEYFERLINCYPIHPVLFDYLYQRWSTLKNFQSTRGILKLMANVLHALWDMEDSRSMIMPASIPLEAVRGNLLEYLDKKWGNILDSEIKRANELDAEKARFGDFKIARSVTRTLFLGTAPKVNNRGLNKERIHLGAITPAEADKISAFNDALGELEKISSYLHSKNLTYWYDTVPTLDNLAENLAKEVLDDELTAEIEKRLKDWKGTNYFKRPHFYKTPADVSDKDSARLVVLAPEFTHDKDSKDSAIKAALECLNSNGRENKNMLVFLAADRGVMISLRDKVRELLAWKCIRDGKDAYNLDQAQVREVNAKIKNLESEVSGLLAQTYCWALSPRTPDKENTTTKFKFDEIKLKDSGGVEAAEKTNLVADKFSVDYFEMDLEEYFWKGGNEISIAQIWSCYAQYCYLSRLKDSSVLLETINAGLAEEKFALADSFDGEKYSGLTFNGRAALNKLLVKGEVADEILNAPTPPEPELEENPALKLPEPKTSVEVPPPPTKIVQGFSFSKNIEPERMRDEADRIYEKILKEFANRSGVKIEVQLIIKVMDPAGIDAKTQNVIKSNCRKLGIEVDFE